MDAAVERVVHEVVEPGVHPAAAADGAIAVHELPRRGPIEDAWFDRVSVRIYTYQCIGI